MISIQQILSLLPSFFQSLKSIVTCYVGENKSNVLLPEEIYCDLKSHNILAIKIRSSMTTNNTERQRRIKWKNCLHFLGINFKGENQRKVKKKRNKINYYFHFYNLLNYSFMLILFASINNYYQFINLLIFQLNFMWTNFSQSNIK